MIDKTINEFSTLMMQGLANQRSAGFDEAARLFAENVILKNQLEALHKELDALKQKVVELTREGGK